MQSSKQQAATQLKHRNSRRRKQAQWVTTRAVWTGIVELCSVVLAAACCRCRLSAKAGRARPKADAL